MFHRVLVPLDGSTLAEGALPHGLTLAKTFAAGIKLMRVLETRARSDAPSLDIIDRRFGQAEAAAYLDAVSRELRQQEVAVETSVVEGKPANQILQALRADDGTDLLLLTSHGVGGPSEFALSGTAHKVASGAGTSVMIVPFSEGRTSRTTPATYRRVLVAFQGSRGDEVAVSIGAALARALKSELLIAHVVCVPQVIQTGPSAYDCQRLADDFARASRKAAAALLEETAGKFSGPELTVRTVVEVSPHVSRSLATLADREDADLVILCAHGIGADTTWLYGSTTTQLIAELSRPILITQDAPRRPFESRTSAPSWVRERFQPLTW